MRHLFPREAHLVQKTLFLVCLAGMSAVSITAWEQTRKAAAIAISLDPQGREDLVAGFLSAADVMTCGVYVCVAVGCLLLFDISFVPARRLARALLHGKPVRRTGVGENAGKNAAKNAAKNAGKRAGKDLAA